MMGGSAQEDLPLPHRSPPCQPRSPTGRHSRIAKRPGVAGASCPGPCGPKPCPFLAARPAFPSALSRARQERAAEPSGPQSRRTASSRAAEKSGSRSRRANARTRRIAAGDSFTILRTLPDGLRPAPGRAPPVAHDRPRRIKIVQHGFPAVEAGLEVTPGGPGPSFGGRIRLHQGGRGGRKSTGRLRPGGRRSPSSTFPRSVRWRGAAPHPDVAKEESPGAPPKAPRPRPG